MTEIAYSIIWHSPEVFRYVFFDLVQASYSSWLYVAVTERFNQTLVTTLSKVVNDHADDWDMHIDAVAFAYRVNVQASTKRSPFELLYGVTARLLQQLADNAPHECIWKESAEETVEAWHHPSLLHLLFFHLPLCHQTLNFPTLSSWVSVFSNSQTQHQVPAPTSPPLPSTLSLLEPDHVSPTPTTQIWSDQKSNAENAQAQTEVVSESTLNHGILMSYHCCVTPPHVLHTEIVSCEAVRSGMFRCWVSVITDAAS